MSDALGPEANVEVTPETIGEIIVKLAREVWEKTQSPLLLSNIEPALKQRGIIYKNVLPKSTSLREFVSTLADRVKIVVHPIHKAKIGIVPSESTFAFEAEPTVKPGPATMGHKKKIRQPNQRFIVMQFLAALSRLTEEERNSVVIPIQVLARLMEEK